MLNNEQIGDVLQKLQGTVNDGEKGFAESAENVKDSTLKSLFTEMSQQRAQMSSELGALITSLGEKPKEGTSVGAALHRGWLNVRDAITGRDDQAVVAEAERGEKVAVDNYEEALREELPTNIKTVIDAQYAKIKASQTRIEGMNQSMKASQ